MMPAAKTPRFRAIVCAVNLSAHGRKALRYAEALSRSCGGRVTAVHGPDAVVVDEARRVHADVVVLPGTTTPAILRRYRGAVLIVPECARLPRRAWPSRSVAATVGRGVHRRARIACAARMGEMFGAWLSVVPASAPGVSSAHLAELFLYPLTRAERERPGARGRLGAVIGAAAVPVMVIRVGSPARMRIRAVRRAA